MEASFLADEHFDVRVVYRLRAKGHDVRTVRQLNEDKAGDRWPDRTVLEEAIRLRRIVLTDNIRDFRTLHNEMPWHEGIVACDPESDPDQKADRIDLKVRDAMRESNKANLTGQWIDARPRR